MQRFLAVPAVLIALGITGASPSFAWTSHHRTAHHVYNYAPGYGSGFVPQYSYRPSVPAPEYAPGVGNFDAGAGPSGF
jgi:hypothetical protein